MKTLIISHAISIGLRSNCFLFLLIPYCLYANVGSGVFGTVSFGVFLLETIWWYFKVFLLGCLSYLVPVCSSGFLLNNFGLPSAALLFFQLSFRIGHRARVS